MTYRAEQHHEGASAWCFSYLCLWLDFHRMLQAPQTGLRDIRLKVPVLGKQFFPPAVCHTSFTDSTLFLYGLNYIKGGSTHWMFGWCHSVHWQGWIHRSLLLGQRTDTWCLGEVLWEPWTPSGSALLLQSNCCQDLAFRVKQTKIINN